MPNWNMESEIPYCPDTPTTLSPTLQLSVAVLLHSRSSTVVQNPSALFMINPHTAFWSQLTSTPMNPHVVMIVSSLSAPEFPTVA
jgi:hypothetical protein